MKFNEYVFKMDEQNTVGYHNDRAGGAYLTSDQTGSETNSTLGFLGRPNHLPSLDFSVPTEIPKIKKQAKIQFIERNKNPIFVFLSDGTRLYFTLDEFNRIPGGMPEVGKIMTVIFQRHPGNNTPNASQIHSCRID